jgi:hypothetical protein
MSSRFWKFFTSLRLTVVLLGLSILLVFVGTVAQADEGLYTAQARYFKHWFVSGLSFFGHHIPLVLPGGYLLGTLLLINLLAAHINRFQWTWKKAGIQLTHAGVILLLVGQLATDIFSRETMLRLSEGETRNYSESANHYELAFASDVGDGTEEIVSVPDRLLAKGGEISVANLPFAIRVKKFLVNSEPSFRAPMQQNNPPLTSNGLGQYFDFRTLPETKTMDDRNVPTALLEFITPAGSLGDWVVSDWSGEDGMVSLVRQSYAKQAGDEMADRIAGRLAAPQSIDVGGKQYRFIIRPERTYRNFSLTLLKFTHSIYPGSDIPKDFRSRVRLDNPDRRENREVEIYMNAPLRYEGETFYQASFDKADPRVTILQVVRNPGWITPYAGCIIVAAGLTLQFMIHLVGFITKRRAA